MTTAPFASSPDALAAGIAHDQLIDHLLADTATDAVEGAAREWVKQGPTPKFTPDWADNWTTDQVLADNLDAEAVVLGWDEVKRIHRAAYAVARRAAWLWSLETEEGAYSCTPYDHQSEE